MATGGTWVYDETFRDGPQSLWGSRMDTEDMLRIAPMVDGAGFAKSIVVSGATFEAAIRQSRQDPWDRLERLCAALPRTLPVAQIRGRTLFGWRQYHDDVVELFMRTLVERGVKGFLVYDALNDPAMISTHLRVARELGVPVWVLICYSLSPAHDDAYWTRILREAAASGADGVTVVDASGLLAPDLVERFLATCRQALAGTGASLELNVHDLTGRALACYREAVAAGVDGLAAVAAPLAHGPSIPAWGDCLALTGSATEAPSLREAEDYLEWVAYLRDHPVGVPNLMTEDEIRAYELHQVPGGMLSNLRRQLSELDLSHLLPAVLDEIALVRAELGYPTMVTPASQLVGVQATMNVLAGERYKAWPTELVNFLAGEYGQTPGHVDQDIVDRVVGDAPLSPPAWEEPTLDGFRSSHGAFSGTEALLNTLFYGDAVIGEFRRTERPVGLIGSPPAFELTRALLERVQPRRLTLRHRARSHP